MLIKQKKCHAEGCSNFFKPYKSTDKFCSFDCAKKSQKTEKPKRMTRIRSFSAKRAKEQLLYKKKRVAFLSLPENQICFIDGCNKEATTIEHRAGRIGKNYLDEKTWAGCCLFHNLELERDPELSKKYQLSKIHDGKKI